MKKVILLMAAALMAFTTADAYAQKKSKAEKQAEKAQQEAQIAALIDRIVPAKNFQFIPYEYVQTATGTTTINRYEYVRVRPGSMEVYMVNCPGVNTTTYDWVSSEKKKDVWVVKIKVIAESAQNLDFDFAINAKTGVATVKVRSNKSLDQNNPAASNSITYKGNIREY